MPFSPFALIILVFAVTLLLAMVQIGLVTIAFEKLGLSPASAMSLLLTSLLGSMINLPLFRIKAEMPPPDAMIYRIHSLLRPRIPRFQGYTVIAVNVGGGLVPIACSIYLLAHHSLPILEVVAATAAVTAVCYFTSRPIPGLGIGIPILVAPLCAALIAIMINHDQSAPLAYICGTVGVLIGADILRLRDIGKMGTPVASIGGAGTFDGIFITGIVAVLLA